MEFKLLSESLPPDNRALLIRHETGKYVMYYIGAYDKEDNMIIFRDCSFGKISYTKIYIARDEMSTIKWCRLKVIDEDDN